MNSSQEILNTIIHYIDKSGKTEKECLVSCEINTSFLTDWKKGKLKTPAYDKIVKLAIFLGIDIGWLFTGEEKSPSTELNDLEKRCLNALHNLNHDDKIEFISKMEQRAVDYPPEVKGEIS